MGVGDGKEEDRKWAGGEWRDVLDAGGRASGVESAPGPEPQSTSEVAQADLRAPTRRELDEAHLEVPWLINTASAAVRRAVGDAARGEPAHDICREESCVRLGLRATGRRCGVLARTPGCVRVRKWAGRPDGRAPLRRVEERRLSGRAPGRPSWAGTCARQIEANPRAKAASRASREPSRDSRAPPHRHRVCARVERADETADVAALALDVTLGAPREEVRRHRLQTVRVVRAEKGRLIPIPSIRTRPDGFERASRRAGRRSMVHGTCVAGGTACGRLHRLQDAADKPGPDSGPRNAFCQIAFRVSACMRHISDREVAAPVPLARGHPR